MSFSMSMTGVPQRRMRKSLSILGLMPRLRQSNFFSFFALIKRQFVQCHFLAWFRVSWGGLLLCPISDWQARFLFRKLVLISLYFTFLLLQLTKPWCQCFNLFLIEFARHFVIAFLTPCLDCLDLDQNTMQFIANPRFDFFRRRLRQRDHLRQFNVVLTSILYQRQVSRLTYGNFKFSAHETIEVVVCPGKVTHIEILSADHFVCLHLVEQIVLKPCDLQ